MFYNFLDTESYFSQLQIQPDDEMWFYKQLCSAKSSSVDKGEVFFNWAGKFSLLLPTSVSYMFYYIQPTQTNWISEITLVLPRSPINIMITH